MRFVVWVLATVLLTIPAVARDGWKTVDPSGIHYAVPRSVLHPDRWEGELLQTYDCVRPCEVGLDDRMSALHLRYKWAQLNPESGVYDFDDVGAVLDLAHNANKAATLIVMAGKYTPRWVFEAGAGHLDTKAKQSDLFSQALVPLPWDPVFLAAYGDMIDALARFLQKDQNRYRAVMLVKNGAVVVHSGEVRLMPPDAFGVAPQDEDAAESFRAEICGDWARAGYSETKVLAAIRISNARIAAAFPDQYLGIAYVGGSNRFPTVDQSGNCSYPAENGTIGRIIRETVNTYGPRAIINNTVFSGDNRFPHALRWTVQNGAKAAIQLNRQLIGCHERKNGVCPDSDLQDAIRLALSNGFTFIEVHDGNIHRNREALRTANAALRESYARTQGTDPLDPLADPSPR